MITSNVYNRVFFIKGSQYGTAFSVDVDGRQYIVTARHLFEDPSEVASLNYFHKNSWHTTAARLVGIGRGEIDIVVFALNMQFSPKEMLLPASDNGIIIGQDIYFAGYPYMMWSDLGPALAGRPAPFIKKGTLSTMYSDNGVQKLFIDAINNQGFSGAPVVFAEHGSYDYRVAGIVSSFRTEYEKVLDINGEATDMTVPYNTGFLLAYSISHAVTLIRMNPIGYIL